MRRLRAVATIVAMTGLLVGALVRCSVPPSPEGPKAFATRVSFAGATFVSVPDGPIDRAALIASLKEAQLSVVILQASASASSYAVNDRVSLAIELQQALGETSIVLVGTYDSGARSGQPMDALLQNDPAFSSCYPAGPKADTETSVIDKVRVCTQDVSKKIAAALDASKASMQIGCYISHETELVDTLTPDARAKLTTFFHDAASPCSDAKRVVGVSTSLSPRSGDPDRAGLLLRDTIADAAIDVLILRDGVGTYDPAQPHRAAGYYLGLRNSLGDRIPVWANIEAFDCEGPSCVRTHPTTIARYTEQFCGAHHRADGIITGEYLHHLGGRSLLTLPDASPDASTDAAIDAPADLKAIVDDTDAAVQLRTGYLEWRDAGGPCPFPGEDGGKIITDAGKD